MSRAGVLALALLASLAPLRAARAEVPGRAEEPPACVARQGCGRLLGRVRGAGERVAVEGARVVVMPGSHPADAVGPPEWTRGAATDAEGRFVLDGLPAGSVRVVVLHEEHERHEAKATVVRGANVAIELYPTRAWGGDYRTVVQSERSVQAEPEARSTVLSREEVRTLPGSQGDALRALQNLPGVARPPGGLGLLVLRGAPPWQSLTMLGEHPVPRAFHALPFAAIVQSETLEGLELLPSNASARYGPLTGGVVQLAPRRPRRDGVHGHGTVDLTGVSAAVEGPLGLGSYMVAARRGWLDGVLRGAERVTEMGFMLPGLWDYQALLVLPAVGDGELELRVLGAGDRVRNRYRDFMTGEIVDAFEFRSQFHRFDLVGRWTVGRTRLLLTPTLRIGRDHAKVTNAFGIERSELAPGWRAELDTRIAPRARLVVGTDGTITPFRAHTSRPSYDELGRPISVIDGSRGLEGTGGAYAIVHFGSDRWRISPGVRAQGFMFDKTRRLALDPRVNARIAVGDRVTLDMGVGRYSQTAFFQFGIQGNLVDELVDNVASTVVLPSSLVAAFEPRVPTNDSVLGLRVITARQASASVEVELPWQLDLRMGAFVRDLDDPARSNPSFTDIFITGATQTSGIDYGGELLLRRRISRRLYGWVAYTLMRSQRDGAGGRVLGDFDQPHNLVALLSYALPRGFRIGGRFRVASGNPYRPVVGAAELQEPDEAVQTTPIYGAENSARFPTFHQLDVRIDKQWTLRHATVTGYLDVLNVYNQQNVEAWIYQPNYRGRLAAFGLPILPVLGVRVDY